MENYIFTNRRRCVKDNGLAAQKKKFEEDRRQLQRLKDCQPLKKNGWHTHARNASSHKPKKLATRSILARLIAQMSLANYHKKSGWQRKLPKEKPKNKHQIKDAN